MVERPLIALTGATGFVGRALLQELAGQPVSVRALARAQPDRVLPGRAGVDWIMGDLSSSDTLSRLVAGADTVIHLAGATKARRPADFHDVNARRTADLVSLSREAGVKHFVHVSSLTALRPEVSPYAQSKAESEQLAKELRGEMALTIIRAPAILGPDDDATKSLFSALSRGILPVPGGEAGAFRFSIIDVIDAARFIASRVQVPASGDLTVAPAGHLSLGWDDIAQSTERVLGKPVRRIVIPPTLMKVAGQTADLAVKLNASPQVFSAAKVRELLSGHWLGDLQVQGPIPLERTLERCLAPFLRSARGF